MSNNKIAPVPCAGCTACCHHEYVVLFPEDGDDPASFDHVVLKANDLSDMLVLRQRPNGDCVYLGDGGCTIHERAPIVCRMFDCRRYFLSMPRAERRQLEKHARTKIEIFAAARERLNTLTATERTEAMRKRSEQRTTVSDRKWLRHLMVQS